MKKAKAKESVAHEIEPGERWEDVAIEHRWPESEITLLQSLMPSGTEVLKVSTTTISMRKHYKLSFSGIDHQGRVSAGDSISIVVPWEWHRGFDYDGMSRVVSSRTEPRQKWCPSHGHVPDPSCEVCVDQERLIQRVCCSCVPITTGFGGRRKHVPHVESCELSASHMWKPGCIRGECSDTSPITATPTDPPVMSRVPMRKGKKNRFENQLQLPLLRGTEGK